MKNLITVLLAGFLATLLFAQDIDEEENLQPFYKYSKNELIMKEFYNFLKEAPLYQEAGCKVESVFIPENLLPQINLYFRLDGSIYTDYYFQDSANTIFRKGKIGDTIILEGESFLKNGLPQLPFKTWTEKYNFTAHLDSTTLELRYIKITKYLEKWFIFKHWKKIMETECGEPEF